MKFSAKSVRIISKGPGRLIERLALPGSIPLRKLTVRLALTPAEPSEFDRNNPSGTQPLQLCYVLDLRLYGAMPYIILCAAGMMFPRNAVALFSDLKQGPHTANAILNCHDLGHTCLRDMKFISMS